MGIALVTCDQMILAGGYGWLGGAHHRGYNVPHRLGLEDVCRRGRHAARVSRMAALDTPLVEYLPSFKMADPRYTKIAGRHGGLYAHVPQQRKGRRRAGPLGEVGRANG